VTIKLAGSLGAELEAACLRVRGEALAAAHTRATSGAGLRSREAAHSALRARRQLAGGHARSQQGRG